ncbi:MAG: hypothetical protein U1E17_01515 [Geminicoccaceae bacterium]
MFAHLRPGQPTIWCAPPTSPARSSPAAGMDEKPGSVAYDAERSPFLTPVPGQAYMERRFSEATAREIDLAVRQIIEAAFTATLRLLRANQAVLERCARELLQVETLEEARLKRADLGPALGARARGGRELGLRRLGRAAPERGRGAQVPCHQGTVRPR